MWVSVSTLENSMDSSTFQVTGTCGHFLKLDNDSGKHGALGFPKKEHMKGLKHIKTINDMFFFWKDIQY